ncbi:MAG: hypothetical protein GXO96_06205 [Nitrospirae bacterium]|nr:hypothetical protein [Candidatus Manganitrophaceae bacterium]
MDYEFGDQTLLSVSFNYLLGTERDDFDTVTGSQGVPSTGGDWVNFTPGIRVQASDYLNLYSFYNSPSTNM